MALFDKLKDRMKKTRDSIAGKIDELVSYYKDIDDDFFEELEDALIASDMGPETAMAVVSEVRDKVKKEKIGHTDKVKALLREAIAKKMDAEPLEAPSPTVILMVGVNGTGKTTTAGKLAAFYKNQGKKVMLAAADTFRAAAVEQLTTWSERADVPIIKQKTGADPAAVAYDAVASSKARGLDVLIIDSAGRLHNKKNFMNELAKISRVIHREWAEANIETFLVVDATTGQNALSQAKLFNEVSPVSGLVITKLDGTAKGGIAVAVNDLIGVPVRFIGVGEAMEDLQVFNAEDYATAIV